MPNVLGLFQYDFFYATGLPKAARVKHPVGETIPITGLSQYPTAGPALPRAQVQESCSSCKSIVKCKYKNIFYHSTTY